MSGKNTSKTNISLDLSNKNFRYVLETVNEKTVQAAAKKLYISQPSLSRFIKNLEAQIGIDLFDRIDGRLILTEAGRRYVEYARKICALEDEAEKAMEQLRLEHREKLRLGIPDYWASFIIPSGWWRLSNPSISVISLSKGKFPSTEKGLRLCPGI